MKIYLVRHGETFWNERGYIQGNVDVGLNLSGRRQSRELAGSFPASGKFDLAVSPLRRARQTAGALRDKLRLENYWVLNDLRELDQGYWNGLDYDRVAGFSDGDFSRWEADPVRNSPPGGESINQVANRVREALKFLRRQRDNPLVLVAHKVINSVVASLAGRWPLEEVLGSLPENAAVFEVRLETLGGDSE